ncbi:hypothetical protein Poli38472_005309 [Pythium oligandrum]|uniref:Uncharacterized protein n=1 Tax=Pythium oligandrum TaxID=41045 RepID=A0A8K1CFT2_PYTOL|nr:hypothetical protein Poli38472_005309 [Pythium oligandrum]|eukprot:TMW62691.1 hypothetical protein Poli38472_005309 [Pythium oligandrum]
MHSTPLRLVLCCLVLARLVLADVRRTYGLYGAIQFLDKTTTVDILLEQCFTGFALNGCEDLNVTAGYHKDYSFASQFTDTILKNQPYCLQCCTKPVPRYTGADETWNLSCPLNDLQRLSVGKGQRTIRFARRETLQDETIIECPMPNRTQGTYLEGYALTVWLIERSSNFGADYWRTVVNCSVEITETTTIPSIFNEVIRLRSIPTAQSRPTAWVAPTFLSITGALVLLSVPLYNALIRGQRCLHCGSWIVVVNSMCVVCICISCRLHPPPPKVYVDNGDPHRETTESEDDSNMDKQKRASS